MKLTNLRAWTVAVLMTASSLVAPVVLAEDQSGAVPDQVAPESPWTYEISPYGWFPDIKGNAALFGSPPLDVDVTFFDIFDAIDWGNFPPVVMLKGEARNGNFGVFFDVVHMAVGVDATTPGPLFSSADLGLTLTSATALGSFRVVEDATSHLDVVAGLRVWSVDANLGLGSGLLAGVSAEDDNTWVDPVVGFKGKLELDQTETGGIMDNLFIEGWGLIGGLGGSSSDFMWDVWGGIGYQISDRFSVSVGWRHIGVDYTKDAFVFDVGIDGPILNSTLKF